MLIRTILSSIDLHIVKYVILLQYVVVNGK